MEHRGKISLQSLDHGTAGSSGSATAKMIRIPGSPAGAGFDAPHIAGITVNRWARLRLRIQLAVGSGWRRRSGLAWWQETIWRISIANSDAERAHTRTRH